MAGSALLPAVGLGTAPLGGLYAEVSPTDAAAAVEIGYRYFDTAPLYGYGAAERHSTASSTMWTMWIDAHHHLWDPSIRPQTWHRPPRLATGRTEPPSAARLPQAAMQRRAHDPAAVAVGGQSQRWRRPQRRQERN